MFSFLCFHSLSAVLSISFQFLLVSGLPVDSGLRIPNDVETLTNGKGFELPILRRRQRRNQPRSLRRRSGDVSGSIGLGDTSDLLYTVPIELGNITTAVHLDTGSSDLWVVTDACTSMACQLATATHYPNAQLNRTGARVKMHYGDSTTGTFAAGPIAKDTATIAGIAMTDQFFGAVNDTSNPVVKYGAAGIFGLGFPSGSSIQNAAVDHIFNKPDSSDELIHSIPTTGPLLSRIAMTDKLLDPMFSITLQRNTIDIGGNGLLTVGKLPDGIDNSSLTWVPVRRYSENDGGTAAPLFAPDEIYPFRWEIEIDGVFLDGQRLSDSSVPASGGIKNNKVTALIDTGNSLIRGPSDVVKSILDEVSPGFAASSDPEAKAFLPCSVPRTLAFQIGGKMFPVDPRDFIGQETVGDIDNCIADNLVPTDPPSKGALFSWSLGDPFMKSNLVAFHYGNLTHPSVDPPRIGFLSMVPSNITAVFNEAVQDARSNGNNFESTYHPAPTASAAEEDQITLSATAPFIATAPVVATTTLNVQQAVPTAVTQTQAGQPGKEDRKSGALAVRTRTQYLSGFLVSLVAAWAIV
ncbi:hypothetical protein HGRIS_006164 [Hohenbuehelia grisea]|uniref:Peptidase A1 domain-containing protein n=1 Tax=Hohenbuehelia grisea TaxID=104357 RepID=A0ABR3K1F7_9AGAR